MVEKSKPESLVSFNKKSNYNFNKNLKPQVQKDIESWDEYFVMSNYLKKHFLHISPALSLEMSKELADLSKKMNDSLKIKELNNKGMFARLNVFYSEALRLQDMSIISSIEAVEVTEQVEKLVSVYNSINMKINSIYLQKSFDNNVNFDESFFEFNEDAEKPYSIPKKSRKKRSIQNGSPSFRK